VIKQTTGVQGLDLHDINLLREFDQEDPCAELEGLGFDFEDGTFKARRVG
jgi:hypothetical protein